MLSLIDVGFNEGCGRIPVSLAGNVWSVLERLAAIPADHPKGGYPDYDPNSLEHETTRSIALSKVPRYLWWRSGDTSNHAQDRGLIVAMPDVGALLDRALDPEREPSQGVRAVFGRYFGPMYWADRAWLHDRIDRLFPDEEGESLWSAAWRAYIMHTGVHTIFFDELRPQYERAVEGVWGCISCSVIRC